MSEALHHASRRVFILQLGGHDTLYGESLALYIGTYASYQPGPVFGLRETFTGLLIVIDTNSKDDNDGFEHKDISILFNNGRMTRKEVMDQAVGCSAIVVRLTSTIDM